MIEKDLEIFGRYPFTSGAKKWVNDLSMSFEDILTHPIYSAALERAVDRVEKCVESKFTPKLSDKLNIELTILSYPLARMISSSAGHTVHMRWVNGESQAAYQLLQTERRELIDEVAADLELEIEGDRIHFSRYLALCTDLFRNGGKWTLTNRQLSNGLVKLDDTDRRLLLKQAIKLRITKPIPENLMPEEVKARAKELGKRFSTTQNLSTNGEVKASALPPCVADIVENLKLGSASHNGMFILATFMANIGLNEGQILNILSVSPKYDEAKARYQLKFITGVQGGTEYTCPTCATIRGQGLCRAKCQVKHPIQYYRNHLGLPKDIKAKNK